MIKQGMAKDLLALARLRAQWVAETGAEPSLAVPGFADRFSAWPATNRRTFFVAEDEASAQLIGTLNLMIFERIPKPDQTASSWSYLANA